MRVIKFRAWDNTPSDIGGQTMLSWDQIRELVEHEIFLDSILEGEHESLIPMQFTGLTDANGVEIYEGDIVLINWLDRRYENKIDVVKWSDSEACFDFGAGATSEVSWSHEVIGNIHQNPELFEADNV